MSEGNRDGSTLPPNRPPVAAPEAEAQIDRMFLGALSVGADEVDVLFNDGRSLSIRRADVPLVQAALDALAPCSQPAPVLSREDEIQAWRDSLVARGLVSPPAAPPASAVTPAPRSLFVRALLSIATSRPVRWVASWNYGAETALLQEGIGWEPVALDDVKPWGPRRRTAFGVTPTTRLPSIPSGTSGQNQVPG